MRPLVFIDTETTGLKPGYHEIVEICLAKLDHDTIMKVDFPEREIRYYLTLPKFVERIDSKAALINGFNYDEWVLKGAFDVDSVAEEISNFMMDCTIVGFNPWFDLRFLMASNINPQFNYHAIDLCSMAYPIKASGKIQQISASEICKFFEIDYSRAHRAAEDVDLAIECYRKLLNYFNVV